MNYLAIWETCAFFLFMGALSIAFLAVSIVDPNGWFGRLLTFGSDNLYLRSVLIGLATNVLVRTKLIEVRGNKIGLEYFYDLSRTWTIGCYQAKASEKKMAHAKRIARQTNGGSAFDEDLVRMVRGALVDLGAIKKLDTEARKLEGMKAKDVIRYRQLLLILAMDNLGIRAVKRWAKSWNKEAVALDPPQAKAG